MVVFRASRPLMVPPHFPCQERNVCKTYLARVHGIPPVPKGDWFTVDLPLGTCATHNLATFAPTTPPLGDP